MQHIWCSGGRDGVDIELGGMVLFLNLRVLGIDVQLVLELGAIGFEVGRALGAEVQLEVEAAHADSGLAFGAIVKVLLHLGPGFLQRGSLFAVPFGAVDLFASLGGASPEATEETDANVHYIGRYGDSRADGHGIDLPAAMLADEAEGEIALGLVAYVLIDIGDRVVLLHTVPRIVCVLE